MWLSHCLFFIYAKQNADYAYMMYVHIQINNDGTIVGKIFRVKASTPFSAVAKISEW